MLSIEESRSLLKDKGVYDRVHDGYCRVLRSTNGTNGINRNVFHTHILNEMVKVPKSISDVLFHLFDYDESFLFTLDKLVCLFGTFMLCKMYTEGEMVHRMEKGMQEFLFRFYNVNRDLGIQRKMLVKFLSAIYGKHKVANADTQQFLKIIFEEYGEVIRFKEFSVILKEFPKSILVRWSGKLAGVVVDALYGDRMTMEMLSNYEPDVKRHKLMECTMLTMHQVNTIQKVMGDKEFLSKEEFTRLMMDSGLVSIDFVQIVLRSMKCHEKVMLDELCWLLSMFCKGTWKQKVQFLFMLFVDQKEDGLHGMCKQQAIMVVNAIRWKVVPEQKQIIDEIVYPLLETLDVVDGNQERKDLILNDFDRICEAHQTDHMNADMFREWAILNPDIICFISDMLSVACIVFGIRPEYPAQEKAFVDHCWKKAHKIHQHQPWYLISADWWTKWSSYAEFKDTFPTPNATTESKYTIDALHKQQFRTHPPRISNWKLQKTSGSRQLCDDIQFGVHFNVLPAAVWKLIFQWYGGGPTICRKVVSEQVHDKPQLVLDLYPHILRLAYVNKQGNVKFSGQEVTVWDQCSVYDTLRSAKTALVIDEDKPCRLWILDRLSNRALVQQDWILSEKLHKGDSLIVEEQHAIGQWRLVTSTSSNEATTIQNRKSHKGGLVGLDNLGNTCFMSSAIQCLSHTHLLTQYFLSDAFLRDINLTSRDGLNGRLAMAYGNLLHAMWTTKAKSVAPKVLKQTIEDFNSAFKGNEQHDAQELLAFLLDGLSEDLNRVNAKPYIEQPDSKGRCDTIVANEWWRNHLQREVSVIVALFTGQFKSLLSCDTCGFESARFEPFTILQLPVQHDSLRTIVLTVVSCTGETPVRCSFRIHRASMVDDLLDSVATFCAKKWTLNDISVKDLSLTLINTSHFITDVFPGDHELAKIRDSDNIVVFQLDPMTHTKRDSNLVENDVVQFTTASGIVSGRIKSCQEGKSNVMIEVSNGMRRMTRVARARIIEEIPIPILCYCIHRKIIRIVDYFVLQYNVVAFGTPFLIRLEPGITTGYELYRRVLKRLQRMFKNGETMIAQGLKNQILDAKDENLMSNIFTIASGEHDFGFGFSIRHVNHPGTTCSRCSWVTGCRGCLVLPNDVQVNVSSGEMLGIDWNVETLNDEFDATAAAELIYDQSITQNQKLDNTGITLERSLHDFTKPENIQEGYCGRCKKMQPSTKTMDIWRTPPVLVIQLKRFQFTSFSRRKLNDFVKFPIHDFDITQYVAISRNSGAKEHVVDLSIWKYLGGLQNTEFVEQSDAQHLLKSPGRDMFMYDLFGVVNHVGASHGGHYVANVRPHGSNQWKCFNDSKCTDIEEKNVVTPAAYLLFYLRKDMILADIRKIFPENNLQEPIDKDTIESLLLQRDNATCAIS